MTEDAPDPRPESTELAEFHEQEVTARQTLRRERGEAIEKQGWDTGWLLMFGFGPATMVLHV